MSLSVNYIGANEEHWISVSRKQDILLITSYLPKCVQNLKVEFSTKLQALKMNIKLGFGKQCALLHRSTLSL